MYKLAVWVNPTVIESEYNAPVANFLENVGTVAETHFPGISWIVDELNFTCPTLIIWEPTYRDSNAGLSRLTAIENELIENLGGISTSLDSE